MRGRGVVGVGRACGRRRARRAARGCLGDIGVRLRVRVRVGVGDRFRVKVRVRIRVRIRIRAGVWG